MVRAQEKKQLEQFLFPDSGLDIGMGMSTGENGVLWSKG